MSQERTDFDRISVCGSLSDIAAKAFRWTVFSGINDGRYNHFPRSIG